ncbi:MAG TPA: SUF system NifU family Fe-S cluster assembly protein [Candidatus Polarisedimenticolaceae bacterium]|nr:SUF system NifU family Fe-S cluster assembly protein [Candidatus Polarisedimenticolaceae bacterium]
MSGELRQLYQEMILDHARHPRNSRRLERPSCSALGHNPLCGDRLELFLRLEQGRIVEAAFEGSGCAISLASASLLTEAVRGLALEEAESLGRSFRAILGGEQPAAPERARLGKLEVLLGVREFPVRVKCATLAWHTLRAALAREDHPVSTEADIR